MVRGGFPIDKQCATSLINACSKELLNTCDQRRRQRLVLLERAGKLRTPSLSPGTPLLGGPRSMGSEKLHQCSLVCTPYAVLGAGSLVTLGDVQRLDQDPFAMKQSWLPNR